MQARPVLVSTHAPASGWSSNDVPRRTTPPSAEAVTPTGRSAVAAPPMPDDAARKATAPAAMPAMARRALIIWSSWERERPRRRGCSASPPPAYLLRGRTPGSCPGYGARRGTPTSPPPVVRPALVATHRVAGRDGCRCRRVPQPADRRQPQALRAALSAARVARPLAVVAVAALRTEAGTCRRHVRLV